MASTYLTRTPASASNRTTWTWSAWIKRSAISTGNYQTLWNAGSGEADDIRLTITNNDQIIFGTDATTFFLTSQLFRDVSAWYHIVLAFDTTQGTASDRAKLYINGSLVTNFSTDNRSSLSGSYAYNNTVGHGIGRQAYAGSTYYDGYMAHVNFTDGTAYQASDFGETDTNGQWKPKTAPSVTYGTNGFFLKFASSGSLGTDSSGNGNDWTKNGSGDQVTDTPDNVFATWNVLMNNNPAITTGDTTFIQGNTEAQFNSSSQNGNIVGTIGGLNTGKFYWENKVVAVGGDFGVGIANEEINYNTSSSWNSGNSVLYLSSGNKRQGSSSSAYGASYTTGDIIGVALDLDANTITFYKNGTSQGSISVVSGYRYNVVAYGYNSAKCSVNFGNPSFSISSGNTDDNGYGNFEYAPPTGYLALCTKNLASELTLPIGKGSDYMNTILWTGDGSNPRSITGVGFQPDWLWTKVRNTTFGHNVYDSTRGNNGTGYYRLETQDTAAEIAEPPSGIVTSLDSDGFSVTNGSSSDNIVNDLDKTYVGWNWKANGGTTSSNTDGSITSTVQANTTAGFSIVTYTGNFTEGATFGHGLGKAPKVVIIKGRTNADNWTVYNGNLSVSKSLYLQTTDAERPISPYNYWNLYWDETDPSSSVVTLGVDSSVNGNGQDYVAYCFAEIEGYSKFGSYIANGNVDGTFVYTGFRPAWVMFKKTNNSTGAHWFIFDSTRNPTNVIGDDALAANLTNQEGLADTWNPNTPNSVVDFVSNGFKTRTTSTGGFNVSGDTMIYLAFAEHPFVDSTGRPVTAR